MNRKNNKRKNSAIFRIFLVMDVILAVVLLGLLLFTSREIYLSHQPMPSYDNVSEPAVESGEIVETSELPSVDLIPTESLTEPPTEKFTEPATEPVMLDDMAEQYSQNPDIIGWIRIEGTRIDYPVMFTPEDEEKYLHKDFSGGYSFCGLPLIDKNCNMNPESDNLIIYSHNMNNGSMFHDLLCYEQKNFWSAHPTVSFKTLYEERTYEILAAFYDRIYDASDNVFKFYRLIDIDTEEIAEQAMEHYRSKALFDTGITIHPGDRLLTLVTCANNMVNGRFVVVAKLTNPQ